MWMHILAVPIGLLILVITVIIAVIVAEYPLETIAIIVLLVLGYWIGANVLGLVS